MKTFVFLLGISVPQLGLFVSPISLFRLYCKYCTCIVLSFLPLRPIDRIRACTWLALFLFQFQCTSCFIIRLFSNKWLYQHFPVQSAPSDLLLFLTNLLSLLLFHEIALRCSAVKPSVPVSLLCGSLLALSWHWYNIVGFPCSRLLWLHFAPNYFKFPRVWFLPVTDTHTDRNF